MSHPIQGNFYVTGLPRSRTTWAANLLTYRGRYCYQDAFLNCGTPEQVVDVIGENDGLSDPMFLLCWRRVLRLAPGPVAVIVRGFESSCDASRKAFSAFDRNFMERLRLEMRALLREPGVRGFDFNHPSLGHELWTHCRPGEPFDAVRGGMLDRMNVQTIIDTGIENSVEELLQEVM